MNKGAQLYEGKAKKVYETDDPSLLIVSAGTLAVQRRLTRRSWPGWNRSWR